MLSPSVPWSTRKVVTPPREPFAGSVTASTIMKSADLALEMKILVPFSTHFPLLRFADILMPPASDPAPGSVMAMQDFRSEEHTSELQSLMRISYAVFCLKKKTTQLVN